MRAWVFAGGAVLVGCSVLVDTSGLAGPQKLLPEGGSEAGAIPVDAGGDAEAGGSSVVLPPPTTWTRVADAPEARHSMRGVWDAKREVVVLFGGTNNGAGPLKDAYEWDGAAWTHRTYADAPSRYGFGFAWDSSRGVAVLMGGREDPADLWELDGTTWKNRGQMGLPTRMAGFTGAYDTKRGRFIGFGGYADAPLGDTWVWDGTTASKLAIAGPPPRRSHVMAYDEARDRVVLFGGYDANGKTLGDMWTFDGTAWKPEPAHPEGPPARCGSCMAYDRARALVVMVGGRPDDQAQTSDEAWLWDGSTWKLGPKGPDRRRSCALVYDAKRRELFLFGGSPKAREEARADAWTLH